MVKNPKVALVHDYLREYGGAERVLETLHEMYPEAPVYTAFVDPVAMGSHWERFSSWDIRESTASRIPFIKRLYSPLRLFASYFFEGFDLSEFDVVISSTNMYMAKAVLTKPETLHISYIHTPPRSLYGYSTASNWKKNPLIRAFGELINFRMRQIDFVTSQRPDILVANSKEVQARIEKFYRRKSVVISPPVKESSVNRTSDGEYFVLVGRLVYAKHPDLAVKVCSEHNLPLKVVGSGPMDASLHEIAGKSVEFLGVITDEALLQLYSHAKALLFPVEDEDFGMVPVEAMMAGVPVISHRSGGPTETIIDGKTGVFFEKLTVQSLLDAITRCEEITFDSQSIHEHAMTYSSKVFKQKMEKLIENELKV